MSVLEVREVTVRFGGNMALDRVNLDAEAGEITGLIGPNGAGKTTLFNVVTGLLRPQRGEVRLDGREISRLACHRRARHGMARTFQRLELFGLLTVRENVELAAAVRRVGDPAGRATQLLDLVGLSDEAEARADELSTGRARLVELARALATEPRVLLLDEPASGQDEHETEAFADVLHRVASGEAGLDNGAARPVAVVLVEHDVQLVMRTCSMVHVLEFGAILASAPPAEIQQDQAVLDAYLGAAPVSAVEGAAS
jgi:branched-chain amino acid transport system ATP-binding protein